MEAMEIIINKLLNVLGLGVMNNCIYDEDTYSYLEYNGGKLKLSRDGFFHIRDFIFDPINDIEQSKYLFTVFTCKEEKDNDLYIQSLGMNNIVNSNNTVDIDGKTVTPIKYRLHVDSSEGSMDSIAYYNISLCYIDMIFRLAGIIERFPDFKEYLKTLDFTTEQVAQRMAIGRKGR